MNATGEMPVMLLDGACALCSGFAAWLSRRRHGGRFLFVSQESEQGRFLLAAHGLAGVDSVVLLEGPRFWTESEAVLAIVGRLGGVWRLALVLRLVPRVLRDGCYRFVARRRRGLFKSSDQCPIDDRTRAGRG